VLFVGLLILLSSCSSRYEDLFSLGSALIGGNFIGFWRWALGILSGSEQIFIDGSGWPFSCVALGALACLCLRLIAGRCWSYFWGTFDALVCFGRPFARIWSRLPCFSTLLLCLNLTSLLKDSISSRALIYPAEAASHWCSYEVNCPSKET
jgi:hypothetical protein